jgi:hypothetical protein
MKLPIRVHVIHAVCCISLLVTCPIIACGTAASTNVEESDQESESDCDKDGLTCYVPGHEKPIVVTVPPPAAPTTETAASGGEPVGTIAQSLTSSNFITIQSASNRQFVEDYAATPLWNNVKREPMVVADTVPGSTSTFYYSCNGTDTYAPGTWTNVAPNLTGMGDESISADSRDGTVWAVGLNSLLRTYHFTSDPCGSAPTIVSCTYSIANFDFPQTYNDTSSLATGTWVGFRTNSGAGTASRLGIGHLPTGASCGLTYFVDPCNTGDNVNYAVGQFTSDGHLQLIYADFSKSPTKIEWDTFVPQNNTFQCHGDVTTFSQPGTNPGCGCTGVGTAPLLGNASAGNNCVRVPPIPSFSIDPNGNWVVAISSLGAGPSCNTQMETHWTLRVTGGSWVAGSSTGCQTSVFPHVASATTNPGHFQTHTTYSVSDGSGGYNIQDVAWLSTNAGSSWAGTFVTGARSVGAAPYGAGTCYFGDFNGLAFDATQNVYFYSTSVGGISPTSWTTSGGLVSEE